MDNKVLKNDEAAQKWYIKHKKKLIIGGVAVVGTAAVITYLLLRGKKASTAEIVDTIDTFSTKSIKSPVTDVLIERTRHTSPIYIDSFLRRLPEGQHASVAQLELAKSKGISIPSGYTYVREYTKYNNLSNCA